MISRQTPGRAPKLSEPLRVRCEPPTIEDAVRAAQGLSSDLEQQVELAAALMGVPHDDVRDHVRQAASAVTTGEPVNGRAPVVVVERRAHRPAFTRTVRP